MTQVYELDDALSTQRTQLTLELTEKCNMRCKYCIYHENGGYREFGKNNMTFEVAKLAIDQFLTNSKKNSYIFHLWRRTSYLLRYD